MHYKTFAQFKGGIQEAGFQGPDPKIDILFAYYNHARGQADLIVGRVADLKPLMEKYGSAFEGGKLLITTQSYSEEMTAAQTRKWSIWLNDSFILGGIHSHTTFYLKGNPDSLDRVDESNPYVFSVTQRELIGLTTFGYSPGDKSHPKGVEYNCTDTRLADAATFKSYVDRVDKLAAAVRG